MLGAWTQSSLTQFKREDLRASVKEVGMKHILVTYLVCFGFLNEVNFFFADAMQYSFMSEVRRMGFDNLHDAWRITDINSNFK